MTTKKFSNHLDYYRFQAEARGIRSLEDIKRRASDRAYLYDRIVRKWLPRDRAAPIAELACGHGSFLHWLQACEYTTVTGVDSSPEQVEFARQVGFKVAEDDVNHWLAVQTENQFAAVVAIDMIEHLPKDDFMELMHRVHGVLAAGGNFISRLPNGDSPFVGLNLYNDITHVWTYTPNALSSLAQMHGYTAVRFTDESVDAIRDHRWFKVPLARLSTLLLRMIVRMATRERISLWSPHLWVCFTK